MKTQIDKKRFGPWALVTGASSGIGKEFVRQLAASGLNVALVARRETLLYEVGQGIAKDFNVEYRTVVEDLSQEGFLDKLAKATNDLDIGLVVSNAGTGNPGAFLKIDRGELENLLRLNTLAHLDIAHHFGQRLVGRGQGGLLFVGAMLRSR
ncbi:MAG: SDR family NAD(P)-dependent oxidoreductase [Silvibacterium sp.]